MKIQSYFAGAALAAFAASAPALAQDQKPAAPAADVVHEWLIVRNTTYIPVIDTVTRKLAEARKAFVAKDPKAAAAGVREAAKLLAGQGAKATAPERKRLAGAAAELDRLAAGLDTAKVKTTRQFDAAYSKALRADVVLRQTAGDTCHRQIGRAHV